MGDIVNLDDVIRKEMERNNVTKPGEIDDCGYCYENSGR